MGTRPARHLREVWTVALVSIGLTACDESIDPLQSTEMAYSIFGHLEATADTQWIRVAPFRASIFSTPDPVDATVWVEEVGSGRRIDLEAIPFTRESGNFGDTLFAFNFRTTDPIAFGEMYRLISRRSDGSQSSSMASVPPDHSQFQTMIGRRRSGLPASVLDYVRYRIRPGTHTAIVQTRVISVPSSSAPPEHECSLLVQHNTLPPPPPVETGGDVQVNLRIPGWPDLFDEEDDLRKYIPLNCEFEGLDVRIILSGEAWPFSGGEDYSFAQAYSNVENGVGFFAGVVTSTTPMDWCVMSGPGVPNHCEFFYGPGTSTLTVRPINNSGFPYEYLDLGVDPFLVPFDTIKVTLRREGESWTREGDRMSNPDSLSPNHFRFPGLLPDRVHIMIQGQLGPRLPYGRAIYHFYCEERTIDLEPGENILEVFMDLRTFLPDEPVNENHCREGS